MKFKHLICLAILGFGTASGVVPVKPPQKPAKSNKRPPVGQFFIGKGNAGALSKIESLPTAAELESIAQKLSGRLRNVDPFGVPTFPREVDAAPVDAQTRNRPTDKITLNQALKTLRLTGISITNKEILIAGRHVFEGDVLMLSFKGEVFLAQVLQVGETQILFRDVKRQEAGTLPHTLIPHLELEPMQNRSQKGILEGKVTPIETIQSQQH